MTGPALQAAISAIYSEVRAPAWAAPNLDGLVDVLRDLSWLPDGPVTLALPDVTELGDDDAGRLVTVLLRAENETAGGLHPVLVRI